MLEENNAPGYLVAAKCLLEGKNADKDGLLKEAAIMAQFTNPRVVRLVGVVTVGEPYMAIMVR